MKRKICLVLAAIALFTAIATCSGCSKESDALIGTWAGEVNYASYFNQGLQSIAGKELAENEQVKEAYLGKKKEGQ